MRFERTSQASPSLCVCLLVRSVAAVRDMNTRLANCAIVQRKARENKLENQFDEQVDRVKADKEREFWFAVIEAICMATIVVVVVMKLYARWPAEEP